MSQSTQLQFCETCNAPMDHLIDRSPDYSNLIADKVAWLQGVELGEVQLPITVSLFRCPKCGKRKVVQR